MITDPSFSSTVTDFCLSTTVTCLIIKSSLTGLLLQKITPQQPHTITRPKIAERPIAAPTPFEIVVSVVCTWIIEIFVEGRAVNVLVAVEDEVAEDVAVEVAVAEEVAVAVEVAEEEDEEEEVADADAEDVAEDEEVADADAEDVAEEVADAKDVGEVEEVAVDGAAPTTIKGQQNWSVVEYKPVAKIHPYDAPRKLQFGPLIISQLDAVVEQNCCAFAWIKLQSGLP